MSQRQGPTYLEYEDLAVSSTAVGFTTATITDAEGTYRYPYAHVTVEDNPVRWSVHGTVPTAAAGGHLAAVGAVIRLDSQDQVARFRAIAAGADATLRCSFGR